MRFIAGCRGFRFRYAMPGMLLLLMLMLVADYRFFCRRLMWDAAADFSRGGFIFS